MEDGVNAKRGRKSKFISNGVDDARDLEGAKMFMIKLFGGASGFDMTAIKENEITNLKIGSREARLVCLSGVEGLSVREVSNEISANVR